MARLQGVQVQYGKSRTLKNGTVKRTVLTEGTLLAQYAQQDADVAAAVPLLEQWRLAGKLASTYFGRYLAQPADRLHPDIKTAEAATGRMSIANPSIQNAPAKGGVRECFIADEGKVLVTADFSSVEMRVAGRWRRIARSTTCSPRAMIRTGWSRANCTVPVHPGPA